MGLLRDVTSANPTKRRIDMLISTKLNIPPLNARMVNRKHLIDRLSTGKDCRLIVISGMAGSGKTCLASQWIKHDRIRAAWYSLDEADNEMDLFFRYLLTSLSSVDNRIAEMVRPLLQYTKRFSGAEIIPFLIEHLNRLPEDIYLVLDDYHLITSREVHGALSYFLHHAPPKTHIVIISRYSIPFSLSHFKVRNQIVEISASDMRFTEKETEQFFEEIIPVKLSVDEVHELARYTEGWVGGLQLFGLSLKGKDIPAGFSNLMTKIDQETTDYLIDEVINVQSEKAKSFLYATALLDRFNADLAREITGMEEAADILDRIYRNNLFLIPLDTEREWYRYHHLFSKTIRKRAHLSSMERFKQVCCKAALWFAKNGYLEDAFRLAFASDNFEFAADLMEDHLLFIHERYDYASGLRWLAKLPHEIFIQRALLQLHECGQKTESFQLSDIEINLKHIETLGTLAFERYKGSKKTLCQDLFIYFKYVLRYYYRNPAHADINQLNKAFRMISPENKVFSGYIKVLIALSYILQGNPTLANAALKEASVMIFASKSMWARILWFKFIATVERMQGNLRRSEAILQQAFEFLERKGLSDTPLKFILYLPLAWISYHYNNLDKALEYATIALKYGERVRFARDIIEGNLLLSLIHLANKETEKANQCMQNMQQVSKEIDGPNPSMSPEPWAARLSMIRNDISCVQQWSNQRKLSIDEPFSLCFIHECLTQAELLHRQGRYKETVSILEKLHERCTKRNMMEAVLEIDLLHAATLYALNDRGRAKEIMEQALSFSESEGYIRPFVNYAPMIFPLLNDMAGTDSDRLESSHFRAILSACGMSWDSNPILKRAGQCRNRNLTQREIEILRLMASGYQYKEIARRAFVSFETVKTHAKHIFEKLDVNTRLQAIRRAEDLHLFGNH